MTTANAYGSLQRLTEDTEKNLRRLRLTIAECVETEVRDYFDPLFVDLLDDFRGGCKELRADLDLLTDETSQL